jgi:hypothetical protein
MKLAALLLPFFLLIFGQINSRWLKKSLLSIGSLLALYFIHNAWIVCFTLVFATLFSIKNGLRKKTVTLFLSIVIAFILVNYLDQYFPEIEFILTQGSPLFTPIELGATIFILLRFLYLNNVYKEPYISIGDSIFLFSFLPSFYLPISYPEIEKSNSVDYKLLIKFFAIALMFKSVFSESFYYWISYNHISSLNTIQALFLFSSAIFHSLSEGLFVFFYLQTLLIAIGTKPLSFNQIKTQGIRFIEKTNTGILLLLLFLVALITYSPLFLLFILPVFLHKRKPLLSKGFKSVIFYIVFTLGMCNLNIHSLNDIIVIFKGLISLKSILIHYNELFILWPFNMSFITTLILLLFPLVLFLYKKYFESMSIVTAIVVISVSLFLLNNELVFSLK